MLLYIHLPFCSSRCRYCDFYSTVSIGEHLIHRYSNALAREWSMRTQGITPEISTVFIGGGTPSVLSVAQWEFLSQVLLDALPLQQDAEWTVECNPESFSAELAEVLASIGVTRLTFGVQSLIERERRIMGRHGSVSMVQNVLADHSLIRFNSVGADVIYGLPGQTVESFKYTLDELLKNPRIMHLSAYELTVAENTRFGKHQRLLPFPADDITYSMMLHLRAAGVEYGFEQYEVSNFARNGHRCRHNVGYWNHTSYVGLGAAAHSFVDNQRTCNFADILTYCDSIEQGELPVEFCEVLDAEMCAREMVFLGLRQTCGLNEVAFKETTGFDFVGWAGKATLRRLKNDGYIIYQCPWWRPTTRGLVNADYIAREIF